MGGERIGLGLSIVKQLVDLIAGEPGGAKSRLQASPAGAAFFTVTLPMRLSPF